MALTRLSRFPYAGKVAHAYRAVHDTPSRQVIKALRRILSPRFEGLRRNYFMGGWEVVT